MLIPWHKRKTVSLHGVNPHMKHIQEQEYNANYNKHKSIKACEKYSNVTTRVNFKHHEFNICTFPKELKGKKGTQKNKRRKTY
jgi:hypothetical protein